MAYPLVSFIVGPAIVLYALSRGKAGMDCSDSSWRTVTESAKNAYYNEAAMIMLGASAVMLVVGGALLFRLVRVDKGRRGMILALLVGVAMAGYALILVSATSWNCE